MLNKSAASNITWAGSRASSKCHWLSTDRAAAFRPIARPLCPAEVVQFAL